MTTYSEPCPMNPDSDDGDRAYQIVAEIGKGAYGTVYKARDMRNDGQFIALKEIRINTSMEDGMPTTTIREIALLKQLENFEHPNIVRLLDVCMPSGPLNDIRLWLVFEHIDQDLAHYLERCPSPGLGPDRIRNLMFQILKGVEFLHERRIVHRDLKPQNILVTGKGQAKLADFGLARVYGFSMTLTSVVVTLYYRSPEVLLLDSYCTAVDLWSCGCIFAELHTRKPLFDGPNELEQLRKIFSIMGLPLESKWPRNISMPWSSFEPSPAQPLERLLPNMDPQARDLLEKLLHFDQNERINAVDGLRHPYFAEELQSEDTHNVSMASDSQNTSSSSMYNSSCDNLDDVDEEDEEDEADAGQEVKDREGQIPKDKCQPVRTTVTD